MTKPTSNKVFSLKCSMEEYMSLCGMYKKNYDREGRKNIISRDVPRFQWQGNPNDLIILTTCWTHDYTYDYLQGDTFGTHLPTVTVINDLLETVYPAHKGPEPQIVEKKSYSFGTVNAKNQVSGFLATSSTLNPKFWIISQTANLNQTAKGEVELFLSEQAKDFFCTEQNSSLQLIPGIETKLKEMTLQELDKRLQVKKLVNKGVIDLKKMDKLNEKTKSTGDGPEKAKSFWESTLKQVGLLQEDIDDLLGVTAFVAFCVRGKKEETQELLKLIKDFLKPEGEYKKELLLGAINSSEIFPQIREARDVAALHQLIVKNFDKIRDSYISLYSPPSQRPFATAVWEVLVKGKQSLTAFPDTIGALDLFFKKNRINPEDLSENYLLFFYTITADYLDKKRAENHLISLEDTLNKLSDHLSPLLSKFNQSESPSANQLDEYEILIGIYREQPKIFIATFENKVLRDYWLGDKQIFANKEKEELSFLMRVMTFLDEDRTPDVAVNIVNSLKKIIDLKELVQYRDAHLLELFKLIDFLEDNRPELLTSLPHQLKTLFGNFRDDKNLQLKNTFLSALLTLPGRQNPLDLPWIKALLKSDLTSYSEQIIHASELLVNGTHNMGYLEALARPDLTQGQRIASLATKKIQLQAHEIKSLGEVDLRFYPPGITPIDKEATLVIGDLHANTLKFLWILINEGVLELNDEPVAAKKLYEQLVDIYNTPVENLTEKDLESFRHIIAASRINPIECVRIMGDELADRGNNDWFTLLLLEQLGKKGQELDIILSNHSVGFLENFKSLGQDKFNNSLLMRSQSLSFRNLNMLVQKGLVKKEEVIKIVKQFYRPNLKDYSYGVDTSAETPVLTLAEHAPVGVETLESSVKLYEIPKETDLLETVALINAYSSQSFTRGRLFDDIQLEDDIEAIPNTKENSRYRRIWNRGDVDLDEQKRQREMHPENTLYGIQAPEKYKGYTLFLSHGHDGPTSRFNPEYLSAPYDPDNPAQSYFPNMINTDNDNGKGSLTGALHYVVSRDIPALKLVKTWKERPELSSAINQQFQEILNDKMSKASIRYAKNKNLLLLMGQIIQQKLNTQVEKITELQEDKISPLNKEEISAITEQLDLHTLEKEYEKKLKDVPFQDMKGNDSGKSKAQEQLRQIIEDLKKYKGSKSFVQDSIKRLEQLQVKFNHFKTPFHLQEIKKDLAEIMEHVLNQHKAHHENTWVLKDYRAKRSTLAPLLVHANKLQKEFENWVDKETTRFEFLPKQYPLALTEKLIATLKTYQGGKDFVDKKIEELEKLKEEIKTCKPEDLGNIHQKLQNVVSSDITALKLVNTWKGRPELSSAINQQFQEILNDTMSKASIRYAKNINLLLLMDHIIQQKLNTQVEKISELREDKISPLEEKEVSAITEQLDLHTLEKEYEEKLKDAPFQDMKEKDLGKSQAQEQLRQIIEDLKKYKGSKSFVQDSIKRLEQLQVKFNHFKTPFHLQEIKKDLAEIMEHVLNEHNAHHENTRFLKDYRAKNSKLAPLLVHANKLQKEFDKWVDKEATRFEFLPKQYPLALTEKLIATLKTYQGGKDFVGKKIQELEKLKEEIKTCKPEDLGNIHQKLQRTMDSLQSEHLAHTWVFKNFRTKRSTLSPILEAANKIVDDLKEWLDDNKIPYNAQEQQKEFKNKLPTAALTSPEAKHVKSPGISGL